MSSGSLSAQSGVPVNRPWRSGGQPVKPQDGAVNQVTVTRAGMTSSTPSAPTTPATWCAAASAWSAWAAGTYEVTVSCRLGRTQLGRG